MSDNREMYAEVNALVGAIAKALDLTDEAAVKALEDRSLSLVFGEDEAGQRFVEASHEGRSARIYQGAIHHQ
jgi:hypothetical protein